MNHRTTFLGLAALMLATLPASAQSTRWIPSNGQSCFVTCDRAGGRPVTSGVHTNGQPYTVCRANLAGEGTRPGYNLQPDWAAACTSGHGGAEKSSPRYDCLCERDRGRW